MKQKRRARLPLVSGQPGAVLFYNRDLEPQFLGEPTFFDTVKPKKGYVLMTRARPLFSITLLGLSVLFQGCANYRVVVPEPAPATDYETTTMHAYLWGAIEETLATENCVDNAIDEVRVKQTLPYVLATVLTLGIWMPLEVEWKCAKRKQGEGTDL